MRSIRREMKKNNLILYFFAMKAETCIHNRERLPNMSKKQQFTIERCKRAYIILK